MKQFEIDLLFEQETKSWKQDNDDFLKQWPMLTEIIVAAMHDKSQTKNLLEDLELLTRYSYWLSFKKESSDASNASDNGCQPTIANVLNAKSALLLLAARNSDVNGLHLLTAESNGENDDHIMTCHQQNGNCLSREKRHNGSESVIGFLHSKNKTDEWRQCVQMQF